MSPDARPTLHLTRRFKASREQVFAAFATLDALKLWLGPGECGIISGELDFRIGGSYRMEMKTPTGNALLGGTYREIVSPQRIVFSWQWLDDEDAPETIVTVEFVTVGAETELRLTHTGFAGDESRGHHEHGWSGSFDKLDAQLATGSYRAVDPALRTD
jgi:uncharacterized protein YndB with AHSA1/START domain